ncbi:MAG: peptidoglycan-binding protein [Gammaproteobacteria bacterium]|nr:MAG: peptidoglycan-binding protein [Gammaproteobacteria bacterium]
MFRTKKLLKGGFSRRPAISLKWVKGLVVVSLLGGSGAVLAVDAPRLAGKHSAKMIDAPKLAPNHPQRYEVVKGDTLWDISGKFLQQPWRWPEIWKKNPSISNPDLIYPGDVLVLDTSGGHPSLHHLRSHKLGGNGLRVVKLTPKIRSQPIEQAIPTIPPSAILPFLRDTLILDNDTLSDAGHVSVGLDDSMVLGKHSEFYARGLKGDEGQIFKIFKKGNVLKNPDTNEILGYETIFLGDAVMLRPGETSKLRVTRSLQEISPGDRLLPAGDNVRFPVYQPHAPSRKVKGRILDSASKIGDMGDKNIVIISLGAREGMEQGHVLRTLYDGGKSVDPVTKKVFSLPAEDSGLLMVFQVYDKVSYGLLLNTLRPVKVNDIVATP